MSRIGKQPIIIPSGVSVKFDGGVVSASNAPTGGLIVEVTLPIAHVPP